MPIVLTEGTVAAKKTASTSLIGQKKAQTKTKDGEKAPTFDDEPSTEESQSCSDLPSEIKTEKKTNPKKQICDIPVYEDYLPTQDEQLETKVRWLIDQQLSKKRSSLAKARTPSSSSSDLDSSSPTEDDSFSDESEKSLPKKKMRKPKTKKAPKSKKKARPKKTKKSSGGSTRAAHKKIAKLVNLLAKTIKH